MEIGDEPLAPDSRPKRVAVLRLPLRVFGFVCIVSGISIVLNLIQNLQFDARVRSAFIETKCQMVATEPQEPSAQPFNPVEYKYHVQGKLHRSRAYSRRSYFPDSANPDEIPSSFRAGTEYSCWYDPAAPEVVLLTRDVHLEVFQLQPQAIGALCFLAFGFLFLAELIQFRIPSQPTLFTPVDVRWPMCCRLGNFGSAKPVGPLAFLFVRPS